MSTTTTTKQDDHGRANAVAWVESLIEMVAKLERESAAQIYVKNLTINEVWTVLREADEVDGIDVENDEACRERLAELIEAETLEPEDFEFDTDAAREEIQNSPLSLQVRSGWVAPGETMEASEFELLLTTGGPALRIRGELNEHREPDRAWLEYQDWGTPWTQYFDVEQSTLLAFCRCFYFGD